MSEHPAIYLGSRGYTIYKENLENDDLNLIRKELTVTPFVPKTSLAKPSPFPIYRESKTKIYLPRFYGLDNYGAPEKNTLSNGSDINVPFVGKIDRIDVYDDRVEIHDYKTSANPPTQLEIDSKFDYKQLPLYKRLLLLDYRFKGKTAPEIRVVWHFLRHKLKYEKTVKDEELEVALDTIERVVKKERKEENER